MKPQKASEKDAFQLSSRVAPTLNESSPWDYWLKLRDRAVDSEYEASVAEERRTLDGFGFKISMAAGVLKLLTMASMNSVPEALRFVWILFSGVILPWIHLKELTHRVESYTRNRGWVLCFYRLAVPLGWAVLLLSQDPERCWDSTQIWSTIVSSTPISALFFATFFFRLPFKNHVILQGIGAVLSWVWVVNFNNACDSSPTIADASNRIGWFTEGLVLTTVVFGIPVKRPPLRPNDFPCWFLGVFFHFWLGFFVPCGCAYHWESVSKTAFLQERSKSISVVDFPVFKNTRVFLMAFVSVVGTQAMWFSFKGVISADMNCRSISI